MKMNNDRSSSGLQSLRYKLCFLSQKGLMQPQLLQMLEGEGARDVNNLQGFADYEQLDSEKNGHSFESRDILQSVVQSCSCCDLVQECKPQMLRNLRDMNYHQNNIVMENYYYSYSKPQHSFGSKLIASENEAAKHKTRIRWTEDLHKKFIECVDRLGGAKKATPKGILKLMKCDGLTIFHIKSHLQKYRVSELMPEEKEGNSEQVDSKTGMQIVEALRLQIDVQRQLYEQLESQKKLQMRIEEQAKQLQTMLQCQLNTKN
ncbi:myb family transcription factor PHL5-like [Salvia miltiorrhiza]|uniref:myb family transcription factor PHL5-like n=1 Tax=Salvia miltiorrhiza TaxID=226208 RepID=UPI0025ACD52F|nr:myb family transcription factor PHL5-like [Salvia miltiorrhiza]